MVGSQLPSHMCVQTQYDARSIRRAACQTDRPSGVRRERDGRAVYSIHVYRRFSRGFAPWRNPWIQN